MKFLHLADLHIGKSLYGVSMIDNEDQKVWVERFIQLVQETAPDAIVIAGDIYDRSSPSGDAVALLDKLLTTLSDLKIPVLMVAGNHDSGQKLSFLGDVLTKQNIHIAGKLEKELTSVTLEDEFGPVTFWMLPYVFPALVSQKMEDNEIRDYQTAITKLLAAQKIDFSKRNVLIAHQNVTAGGKEGERGGSETMVGGVGQIDYSAFDGFDYVALGHIHSAYPVGREGVRYAGSPLCYHFEETKQKAKGPILVELGEKTEGDYAKLSVETQMIAPLHPLREFKGTYEDIKGMLECDSRTGEYIRIVVTDQRINPYISGFLRELLSKRDSKLLELVSEFAEQGMTSYTENAKEAKELPIEELFAQFFADRRDGENPDEKQMDILSFVGNRMREMDIRGTVKPEETEVDKLLAFVMGQED